MSPRTFRLLATSLSTSSCLALLSLVAPDLSAQSCSLVQDLDTTATVFSSGPYSARRDPAPSAADGFVKCGQLWYLRAATVATGDELWKTDGTVAGTHLVKDIHPGFEGSYLFWLTCCDLGGGRAMLYLTAHDGANGMELWRSDGTATGTAMVKDILPGSDSSQPEYLECMNGRVYFTASDGVAGRELWTSDGTVGGTVRVLDIWPGYTSSDPSYLRRNPAGDAIYFQADDGQHGLELWRTGGTAATTSMLGDLQPSGGSSPRFFVNHRGVTLFSAAGPGGSELWRTDGTTAGTAVLADINPSGSSAPNLYYPAAIGDDYYFAANDGQHGFELWKTDATTAGTLLVADVAPGPIGSSPAELQVVGDTLYFVAWEPGVGRELHKLAGGTVSLVLDIHPGRPDSAPEELTTFGDRLLFSAITPPAGRELWISDGSSSGTTLLRDLMPGEPNGEPWALTDLGSGAVLFSGDDPVHGRELWITSGTTATTLLFADLDPTTGTNGSNPSSLLGSWGNTLYFSAGDGTARAKLWKWDAHGVSLVKDILVGSMLGSRWLGDRARTFFTADDGTHGEELWTTDGTAAGTALVKDISPGVYGAFSYYRWSCWYGLRFPFAPCRGEMLFGADDGTHGTELWTTDGTTLGTHLVTDIWAGASASGPYGLVRFGDRVVFSAATADHGRELWISDGTGSGTGLVADIAAGPLESSPSNFVAVAGRLYFTADDGIAGRELWSSDGTVAGTVMVKDIRPGPLGSMDIGLGDVFAPFLGELFFTADDGTHGTELWVTDGTAAGTTMVADIEPGPWGSSPWGLTSSHGRLFFAAEDSAHGHELWVSDGTAAGTVLVADIKPGVAGSYPLELVGIGRGVYFTADDGVSGTELWTSDGYAAGTRQVCDIRSGSGPSWPSELTVCDGRLFFRAYDPTFGEELWTVREPGATTEILGDGSPTAYPELHCTNPILGRAMTITGRSGPAHHAGILILGLPRQRPGAVPFSDGACSFVDLNLLTVVGTFPPPSFRTELAVPISTGLSGAQAALQVWWLDSRRLRFQTSNGIQLTLGD